ncbi:hypothetical protein CPB85DRAFT_1343824 [Mucidula mucida]|nr:hypothetical protein CPB85DRAFT_1343824 [Mucidula mucida]
MQSPSNARRRRLLCQEREGSLHTEMTTYSLIQAITSYCTGVESFAAWYETEQGEPLPEDYITSISPRRLSLAFGVSSPFECTTPSLTHLHIYDPLRLGVEHRIDWKALVQFCPKLTHILLDVDSEHVEDWDDELLGEVTVNRFRDILHVVPPTFKALIFEVLESKNDSWVNDVRREDEYSGLALMSQAEGFDVAAANLVHVISDNQFVFIVPNSRFAYVSGLVSYEYTHYPLVDWFYRVDGRLDAFEMADRHLSAMEEEGL